VPKLERPGAVINYEVWTDEAGPAPVGAVTLVNGHTRPLNDFRMLGRSLASRGLRVVALDNRGAGLTEHTAPFTLADMAGDVLAVLDAEGVRTTHLLGISMGGFITQTVAHRWPTRVARLIQISTAAHAGFIRKDEAPWSADVDATAAKLAAYFTTDFATRNAMLVKSMAKQIAKAVADGDYTPRAEAQRAAIAGYDGRPFLGDITAEALVIHGDQDAIIPLSAGEALAHGLARARLEILTGSGHLLLAERPRDLYDLVGEFFGA
jgi:3-oxoadipate enol-lactonase/4-carboxymuconolactone decarboxylase